MLLEGKLGNWFWWELARPLHDLDHLSTKASTNGGDGDDGGAGGNDEED